MPSLVTLGDLVTQVRENAEMENSEFVTDMTIKRWLLSSFQAVRDQLLQAGQEVERSTYLTLLVKGQSIYPLPENFYRLLAVLSGDKAPLGVDFGYGSGESGPIYEPAPDTQWRNATPFMMGELGALLSSSDGAPAGLRYRARGTRTETQLELLPVPAAEGALRIEYLTALEPSLLFDGTAFNGYCGFETIPVYEATAACLAKQQSDGKHWLGMAAREWERLRAMAPALDRTNSERMVDVYAGGGFGGRGRGRGRMR